MTAIEPVSEEMRQAIARGEKAIYAFGEVVYRDIFKRKRRTEFCYSLSGQNFWNSYKTSRANPDSPFRLPGISLSSTTARPSAG